MNIRVRTTLIAASIVIMLTAAFGIIYIGRSSMDYEEKLEQAGIYLENQDYDNAIAIYNGVISEHRDCSEAYVGLSEAYFSKKRTDKAAEILKKGMDYADDEDVIMAKWSELFPDIQYADASDDDDDQDDEYDESSDFTDDFEDTEITAETSVTQTEQTVTEVTTVPQETETEAETTVPTTAATVPTTTAAPVTVTVTEASVIVTTAPPAVTAPPATTQATTQVTTQVTTVQTTAATTTVTTTEALKDVSVPDLTRMTLDEAYAWCSKNNVILNVVGTESNSAKILSQSPAPDSTVKENSSIIAVLAE